MIELLEQLEQALYPEDIFGAFPEDTHRSLMKEVHPDKHVSSPETIQAQAAQASTLINSLWVEAKKSIAAGTYGQRVDAAPIAFRSRKQQYVLTKRLAVGGTCAIYTGEAIGKTAHALATVRIPHSAEDNDLMTREADAFQAMAKKGKDISTEEYKFFGSRLPIFIESIRLSEPGSKLKKVVNTFARHPDCPDNWLTLEQVKELHPKGIDPKHAVWMWNRLIEGLTFAHASGIMHGALTPNHLIIHPETHLGQVIDWTASGKGKVPYLDISMDKFFSDNVFHNHNLSVTEDIYTLARSMLYVLGGGTIQTSKSNLYGLHCPEAVPETIKTVLNKCLQPKARNRIRSMSDLHSQLGKAAEAAYGPPKFIPFGV